MKTHAIHLLTLCLALSVPAELFAACPNLSDSELQEIDGVTCGFVDGEWTPGDLKKGGACFKTLAVQKKAYGKKAKKFKSSNPTKAKKFKKKKKAVVARIDSETTTCSSAGGENTSILLGLQYYASSCGLSGCHGGEDPAQYAGHTAEQINAAFSDVSEMSLLTPPSGDDMVNLVNYLASLQ